MTGVQTCALPISIVPRIYFRNPSISLVASKPGLENMLFAQVLERIDNKLIKRMKIKNQIKLMVQDAFMFGTCVGKLGYRSEEHTSELQSH